jgi:hypothetical protein
MKIFQIVLNVILGLFGFIMLSVAGDDIHLGFGIVIVGIAINGIFTALKD